eukprot:TRINITY_DN556_c0_g1_i1.p1 TRINITY_DN556_c0_g1~~TRINITY_DN556_c0_g1_i1.p1  ORF type:complete len:289 (-),score=71.04 TRINITY_DN556_c0_g1_i1:8-874(-)
MCIRDRYQRRVHGIQLMKYVLLILAIIGYCHAAYQFVYKDAKFTHGNETPGKAFGDFALDTGRHKYFEIEGLVEGASPKPFGMIFELINATTVDGGVVVEANCSKVLWERKGIEPVIGKLIATGTSYDHLDIKANCMNPQTKDSFAVEISGNKYNCSYYTPADASVRAQYLIGEKQEKYMSFNVLTFAVYGYPYISKVKNCRYFLTHVGSPTKEMKPGFIIVGTDGKHCAILDKEGEKFIHTNPVTKIVTAQPNTMLKEYFREGYVIKGWGCAPGPHQNSLIFTFNLH